MTKISDTPMEELLLHLNPSWKKVLEAEFSKQYFAELANFLQSERASKTVYPPKELIFNALGKTPYQKVNVVIIGQDPYHAPGQAHGLSFSVQEGTPFPPSLKNIFKELHADLGIPVPKDGCLTRWAEQGVLMLNASLTVVEGKPLSHARCGWNHFTDAIVIALAKRNDPVIFVLWGNFAQQKCTILQTIPGNERHHYLFAPHPSPLSAYAGFFGCRHFSKINELLALEGRSLIKW